jgi:hypothetical protein
MARTPRPDVRSLAVGSLLLVALALVVARLAWSAPVVGVPAGNVPAADCTMHLPGVIATPTGPNDSLIDNANRLMQAGRLDAAQRLFERALAVDAPDGRAAAGLVRVQARRAEGERLVTEARRLQAAGAAQDADACFDAAARVDATLEDARNGSADPATATARAADRWDSFQKAWLAPASRVLLPFLAVLAVLLVAVRLVTPVVVPVDARAPGRTIRRVAWVAGLVFLLLSAACVTLLGPVAADWPRSWQVPVVVVLWFCAIAASMLSLRVIGGWLASPRRADMRCGSRSG